MTGLALESSDMDMVVTGLDIPERQVMIEDIQKLAEALEGWDLIQDMKALETASIPVIKAKINLKILKEKEMTSSETDEQQQNSGSDSDEVYNGDDAPWILPIDITFDDSPSQESVGPVSHQPFGGNMPFNDPSLDFEMGGMGGFGNFMHGFGELGGPIGGVSSPMDMYGLPPPAKTHSGISSFNLLKDYVSRYPCLREVGLLLKKFLVTHDLNSAYHGKSCLRINNCYSLCYCFLV